MDLPKKINVIQITTSLRCNLKCPYCFQKVTDGTYTCRDGNCSYKQLEALEHLLKNGEYVRFVILGGEPFLELDFIDSLIKWCEERSIVYSFVFLTNGLLMNSPVVLPKLKIYNEKAKTCGFIISFDNDCKSPYKFGEERYRELSEFKISSTYVVDGKNAIKDIVNDVGLLNSWGQTPKVLYDYEHMYELKDSAIADEFVAALKSVRIDTHFYNANPEECGFVYVNELGEIGPCYNTFYKNIDVSQMYENLKRCEICDIKSKCSHCGPRTVLYGDNWCAYSRCIARALK